MSLMLFTLILRLKNMISLLLLGFYYLALVIFQKFYPVTNHDCRLLANPVTAKLFLTL